MHCLPVWSGLAEPRCRQRSSHSLTRVAQLSACPKIFYLLGYQIEFGRAYFQKADWLKSSTLFHLPLPPPHFNFHFVSVHLERQEEALDFYCCFFINNLQPLPDKSIVVANIDSILESSTVYGIPTMNVQYKSSLWLRHANSMTSQRGNNLPSSFFKFRPS